MAYGICRIQKIKGWGKLAGSGYHTTRERETLNADPEIDNIRLIGKPTDPDLATMVRDKIGDQTIRKNAVLAVEMLLSASPEYFRPDDPSQAGVYNKQRLDVWTKKSVEWLTEQYQDRVVRAELHLDESTPHIHAYLVPLDEKGKLNCRALFGGSRHTLSKLQDNYAEAVKPLGLERGIKGSQATYTKVKQYYTDVNRDSLNLDLEQQLPQPKQKESAANYRERVIENLQPSLDIINHQLSDRTLAIKQKDDMERKALASEKERQLLEERVKELEEEVRKWREQANQLRDLPLSEVADELGLDPDPNNAHKWKNSDHVINIAGSKFYDFIENQGGGGAIDLVMHVNECNFKQAVAWLGSRFGESGMLKAVAHHAREEATIIAQTEPVPKFALPPEDATRWSTVRRYLTDERKLPENWVDALHASGLVYADSKQNAVFVMRSLEGETTGAFLRGTAGLDNGFIGLAKGSKRRDGWFYVNVGSQLDDPIQQVVLTKSPIDALSLAALNQPHSQRTMYLVADSCCTLPVEFLREVPQVIAAYDNDLAGNETVRAIKYLLPQATRLRPKAKDWNEELQVRWQHEDQNRQKPQPKSPQMEL